MLKKYLQKCNNIISFIKMILIYKILLNWINTHTTDTQKMLMYIRIRTKKYYIPRFIIGWFISRDHWSDDHSILSIVSYLRGAARYWNLTMLRPTQKKLLCNRKIWGSNFQFSAMRKKFLLHIFSASIA